MKNIFKLVTLTIPFLAMVGCTGNTWEKEKKASESSVVEEIWNQVTVDEWNTRLAKIKNEEAPKYAKAIGNGNSYDDGDYFHYEDVVYTRSGDKYVTNTEGEGIYQLTSFVNMKAYDLDVEHLGDGGNELVGDVYISSYGRFRLSWSDGFVASCEFNEFAFMTSIKMGSVENPTAGINVTIDWYLEA